jgi:hypothetical protein
MKPERCEQLSRAFREPSRLVESVEAFFQMVQRVIGPMRLLVPSHQIGEHRRRWLSEAEQVPGPGPALLHRFQAVRLIPAGVHRHFDLLSPDMLRELILRS